MESEDKHESKGHDDFGVLPPGFGGGPRGLGEPEDRTIRELEWHLIYKKLREASKQQCPEEYRELGDCLKERGAFFIRCRPQNEKMKKCQLSWFNNEDFKNKIVQQYLDERAEYRRTGVTKKQKEKAVKKEKEFQQWLEQKHSENSHPSGT